MKRTEKAPKSFTRTIDGAVVVYRRTEKGYCYRGGARIKASEFEQAEINMLRERQESESSIMGKIEGSSLVVEKDGHRYTKNHAEGKFTRDGSEISRAEFDREVHGGRKRAPRRRRPEEIGFEHDGIVLTPKQADFLQQLAGAGEETLGDADSGWWVDMVCDSIGGQFAGRPMSVGAMVSTLCEKGLGERSREDRDQGNGRTKKVTSFKLTDRGRQVWSAMGLD